MTTAASRIGLCGLLAVTLALAGCGGGPAGMGQRGGLEAGQPMPEIVAEAWINGEPPVASERAGKVTVVVAWAFWCGPCAAEAPHLVKTWKKYKDQDVQFIGLTVQDSATRDRSEAFLKRAGIEWPNAIGAGPTLEALKCEAIPAVWVVDRSGKIVWNFDSDGDLEPAIDRALAEKPAA
jgi:thiol-disulfide isomerase/thioredoxin